MRFGKLSSLFRLDAPGIIGSRICCAFSGIVFRSGKEFVAFQVPKKFPGI